MFAASCRVPRSRDSSASGLCRVAACASAEARSESVRDRLLLIASTPVCPLRRWAIRCAGIRVTFTGSGKSIAILSAPSAASCSASDSVGCACIVRCRSSVLAEYSIASTASAISSPAIGPMMCTPRISSSSVADDDLAETGRRFHRARATAGEERERADLVGAAAALDLFFGLAHPGDLRRGVDHGRNRLVVHLADACRRSGRRPSRPLPCPCAPASGRARDRRPPRRSAHRCGSRDRP